MIVSGIDSSLVARPLLLAADGSVIVSASNLTTTGGKFRVDANGDVYVTAADLTTTGGKIKIDASGRVEEILNGWISGASQKAPLPFGASGAITRAWSNTNIGAGTTNQDDSAVPTGEIWIITNFAIQYNGTVPSSIIARVVVSSVAAQIFKQISPVSTALYDRQGMWVLFPGDFLRMQIVGGTAGDDVFAEAIGYRLDIDQ